MASRSSKRGERKRSRTTLVSRTAFRALAGISDAELTFWEREELITPVSDADRLDEPLYDTSALKRARLIRTLTEDLEVNLPGLEVILHLLDQLVR